MGPQACGKGTQGEKLSHYLNLPLVTPGALLRDVPETHPRHKELTELLNKGELAPFDLTAQLIKDRIAKEDCKNGYILDGWARSVDNLNYFNPEPDFVIVLNLPREESLKRVSGRRMCSTDGKIYNINTLPKEELAKCVGELIQREDDTEEAVNRRLDIYYSETVESINYLRTHNYKVIEVDGNKDPDSVFQELLSKLQAAQATLGV